MADDEGTGAGTPTGRSGLFGRLRVRRTADVGHVTGVDPDDGEDGGDGRAPGDGGPSPVADLDDTTFEAGTEGGWTVVDFWAPWCGPCRTFHPVFDRVAASTDDVRFARCNVDESPRSAGAVGVQSIPTVVLFDPDGNEVHRLVGVPSPPAFAALLRLATTAP
jgi:thioredoxin 1